MATTFGMALLLSEQILLMPTRWHAVEPKSYNGVYRGWRLRLRVGFWAAPTPHNTVPARAIDSLEDSIYVRPMHVGKGIGKLLLPELIARCQEVGARMIAVIGDTDNPGFDQTAREIWISTCRVLQAVGFKFERWLDTVLMQRSLGFESAVMGSELHREARLSLPDPGNRQSKFLCGTIFSTR